MEEPFTIGKASGPCWATFACKSHQDWLDGGDESDEEVELHAGCTVPFADYLPPLGEELPPCPHCGGQSILDELLVPVAG
jgi:hypothetical protein